VEVTYTLQPEDLHQLERYLSKRGGGGSRLLVPLVLGVFAVSILLPLLQRSQRGRYIEQLMSNPLPFLASTFVPFLLFCLFWLFFLRWNQAQQKKQWATLPALTQPHTTRLTPAHLYNRDASGESITYWHSLHDVGQDENGIYLFNAEQTAFIVPRRAFADEAQAQQFFEQAHGYWQQARGADSKPPIPEPPGADSARTDAS
jgi:hypothetical protein